MIVKEKDEEIATLKRRQSLQGTQGSAIVDIMKANANAVLEQKLKEAEDARKKAEDDVKAAEDARKKAVDEIEKVRIKAEEDEKAR